MADTNEETSWESARDASRRVIGLALVVAVVVAILVVAAARGRVAAGSAVARPVAPVPQVGDCVTANVNEVGDEIYVWSPAPPFIRIEPCTGSRFGEVAYIIPDFTAGHSPAQPGPGLYSQCRSRADEYLGIPPRPAPDAAATVPLATAEPAFLPAATVSTAYLGPDVRARAGGQTWGACVVYLPVSMNSQAPITVDHPLRGAWLRDGDSRLFAVCLDRPTALDGLDCHTPHPFEKIGVSIGTPFASAESIDAACHETAVQTLGSAGPLDSGVLTAQVVPVRPSPIYDGTLISGPAAISTVSPYVNNCLLTSTDINRRLTGPLRGLGDAPVPLN